MAPRFSYFVRNLQTVLQSNSVSIFCNVTQFILCTCTYMCLALFVFPNGLTGTTVHICTNWLMTQSPEYLYIWVCIEYTQVSVHMALSLVDMVCYTSVSSCVTG